MQENDVLSGNEFEAIALRYGGEEEPNNCARMQMRTPSRAVGNLERG
jgi:hypothetical protein